MAMTTTTATAIATRSSRTGIVSMEAGRSGKDPMLLLHGSNSRSTSRLSTRRHLVLSSPLLLVTADQLLVPARGYGRAPDINTANGRAEARAAPAKRRAARRSNGNETAANSIKAGTAYIEPTKAAPPTNENEMASPGSWAP